MADLADIFKDKPAPKARLKGKKQKKAESPAAPEPAPTTTADIAACLDEDEGNGPDALEQQAHAAAAAYDVAAAKRQSYESERCKLTEEVDRQLRGLREDWEAARKRSGEATEALKEAMDKAGISKIPMRDRKPIKLKTTAGKKKPITKTWLTGKYGKQKAESIWADAPNYPPKKEVVIPPRYEDEPSD
jgi:hypothetical protein